VATCIACVLPEAVNATETGSGKVRAEQEATSDDAVKIKPTTNLFIATITQKPLLTLFSATHIDLYSLF
jgi:hypothetical protein